MPFMIIRRQEFIVSKPAKRDHHHPESASDAHKRQAVKVGSPGWLVPVMLACFLIGLFWVVIYYIAGDSIPGMRDLGNWNIPLGFVFILAGFGFSTRWK